MIRTISKIAVLFVFASSYISAQERVTIVGDSLVGGKIDGESIREVFGNVVITQGDVTVTCRKALQFLNRNEFELTGNVVATQDTITLFTEKGRYFGEFKMARSDTSIMMYDGNVVLSADFGTHFFDEKKSVFTSDVELFDSLSTLKSDELIYYNDLDKAVATGNVIIADSSSVIYADSLIHIREKNYTKAFENVKIKNPENNTDIFCGMLEDFGDSNYTKISINPVMIKIDTSNNGRIDSLLIAANFMESFDDDNPRLKATDSVEIVRGEFSSINERTVYFRDNDAISTYKKESEKKQPVMWFGNTQLLGDSVYIKLIDNQLNEIDIFEHSIIISKNENFDFRYDQISGDTLKLFFKESKLDFAEVFGGVLSIYYIYDENAPEGLIKATSKNAKIIFNDNKVNKVNLYVEPDSEYHPEKLVRGSEKEFTLPSFMLFENRPNKESILKRR
ncbi:MAG: OstA-like protein [Melioribacteraceae bacterium]|nr:OstA-like protein [Melioribacteraceae bacterium]